ncbi:MAG: hypothetical protein AAF211_19070 [Myxococcota bacterium]
MVRVGLEARVRLDERLTLLGGFDVRYLTLLAGAPRGVPPSVGLPMLRLGADLAL